MASFRPNQQDDRASLIGRLIDFVWFRPGELGAIIAAVKAPKPAKITYRYVVVFLLMGIALVASLTAQIEGTILFLAVIKASLKALYRQGFFQLAAGDALEWRLQEMMRKLENGDDRARRLADYLAKAATAIAKDERNPSLAKILGDYAKAYEANGQHDTAAMLDDASRRLRDFV